MRYFRVDGNAEIGTGHIMRCLSIARAFQNSGESVTFIVADLCCEEIIRKNNINIICLESTWNELDKEIEQISFTIVDEKIECLIIDSYFVTNQYLRALRKITKLVYIDDIDSMLYPVDVLINYNIYAEKILYQERYRAVGLDTDFVLGCAYVPLRKEFSNVERKINKSVKRILITSGGTDTYNVIGKLLHAIQRWPDFADIEYHVIIGALNKNKELLLKLWRDKKNIHLHFNTPDMAKYMVECDVAITAGGSTAYELCACGTPSIIYTVADNQRRTAETFSEMCLMYYAGDVRGDMGKCFSNIEKYLRIYMGRYDLRKSISQRMQSVVDGKGCENIVSALMNIVNSD